MVIIAYWANTIISIQTRLDKMQGKECFYESSLPRYTRVIRERMKAAASMLEHTCSRQTNRLGNLYKSPKPG